MPDEDLARYQAALLDVLARTDLSDEERARLLRNGDAFAPFASYVAQMEPCFIALGADVMRKWGRRRGDGG